MSKLGLRPIIYKRQALYLSLTGMAVFTYRLFIKHQVKETLEAAGFEAIAQGHQLKTQMKYFWNDCYLTVNGEIRHEFLKRDLHIEV